MAKAKKKEQVPPPAMGSNIRGLHDDIKKSYDRIEELKKERQAINAEIKAEREKMEAKGITKIAFDSAMAYVNMSPEKREGFDTGYLIAREGLGLPVKGAQADLFGGDQQGAETLAEAMLNAVVADSDDGEYEND